jgi:hypothetical protein
VRAARASPEVRKERAADPVLVLNDDGLLGMDLRPGGGHGPFGKRLTQEDHRRLNKDDLLYWFNQRYPPPDAKPVTPSQPVQHQPALSMKQRVQNAASLMWGPGRPPPELKNKPLDEVLRAYCKEHGIPMDDVSHSQLLRGVGRKKP